MEEGEVARDGRVLVDSVGHLLRAEDDLVLGQHVGDVLAVVRTIISRGHPRDHVVLATRRERHDQQEFRVLLAWQTE